MNTEIQEMPLTWPEKLDKLDLETNNSAPIGEGESRSAAYMAANRINKETGKVFSIRKNKVTGESRIWRIK